MEELLVLKERLENALTQLKQLRFKAIEETTRSRLAGKVQGVELALGYLEEQIKYPLVELIEEVSPKVPPVKPYPRPSRGGW